MERTKGIPGFLRTVLPVSVMCLVLALALPTLVLGDGEPPFFTQATEIGNDSCLECHDGYSGHQKAGLHGMASGGKANCESCHGPGSMHAESSDPAQILHPDRNATLVQMNCVACHPNMLKGWKGHKIEAAGMNCNDCHSLHQPAIKGTLKAEEKELCTSCHIDVKGKIHLPSHHPVHNGRMECSSCHDMTGKTLFAKERVNEMCLECHAQYRGPFIFEHAPVAEDCTICHDPHGTVANNLLKQNEPFLCLSCHQMHFHTQLPGYVGDFTSPVNTDRSGHSKIDSMKSAFLTKCTQCHKPVHGSDLPSQSISGQGKSLTR